MVLCARVAKSLTCHGRSKRWLDFVPTIKPNAIPELAPANKMTRLQANALKKNATGMAIKVAAIAPIITYANSGIGSRARDTKKAGIPITAATR